MRNLFQKINKKYFRYYILMSLITLINIMENTLKTTKLIQRGYYDEYNTVSEI